MSSTIDIRDIWSEIGPNLDNETFRSALLASTESAIGLLRSCEIRSVDDIDPCRRTLRAYIGDALPGRLVSRAKRRLRKIRGLYLYIHPQAAWINFRNCSRIDNISFIGLSVDEGQEIVVAGVEVVSGNHMFCNCSRLVRFPENMYMNEINDGVMMFCGCSRIRTIPEHVTLESLTLACGMFKNCTSLCRVPDAVKLERLEHGCEMFAGCSKLEHVPEINLKRIPYRNRMFAECYRLDSALYDPNSEESDSGLYVGHRITIAIVRSTIIILLSVTIARSMVGRANVETDTVVEVSTMGSTTGPTTGSTMGSILAFVGLRDVTYIWTGLLTCMLCSVAFCVFGLK